MALVKVQYMGLSSIREIAAGDPGLAARNIKVDKDMRWDVRNGWAIVVGDMSDELESMFREEGTFTLTELDEATGRKVQVLVTASRFDDTGATVVDATSGQKAVKKS